MKIALNHRSLLYFSVILVMASIFGNSILCDDTLIFEPNTVKTWDTGFLFRESLITLEAHDMTSNINESWRTLMMYIMDDSQYQSYIETNSFDSFTPRGSNLEGIASTTDTSITYRIPYEDYWHVVIINTRPASKAYLEKIFMIRLEVELKAGFLRYPGFLGILIAGILYYRKRSEADMSQVQNIEKEADNYSIEKT